MAYTSTKGTIDFKQPVTIIYCEDCGMKFVLYAIVGTDDISVFPQALIDFCPYCGKDQRG
jgi:transcription elongation factor Elf1